jgi:hypothetical protein
VLDGKPPSGTTSKWDGIRGGSRSVAFRKPDGSVAEQIDVEAPLSIEEGNELNPAPGEGPVSYSLSFGEEAGTFVFRDESLSYGQNQVIAVDRETFKKLRSQNLIGGGDAVLSSISFLGLIAQLDRATTAIGEDFLKHSEKIAAGRNQVKILVYLARSFSDMQFLDPIPANLRNYSSNATRLAENGEGFAAVIREIELAKNKSALLDWLKELRPDEVDDVYSLEGLINDYMVAVREGNREFRAPVLSDGTLRFIALAAAFFQPSMPKVLVYRL